MKKILIKYWPFLFFLLLIFLTFHQTFLFGRLPFPGDLILSEYAPWRQSSYFGYAPGAIPTKAQYFDVIRELYPWKTLVIEELKSGRWPLWNPYNFSGTPLLANFQSAVFYPGNIFYLLFPQPIAWTILIILQPLLMLIFTYAFARTLKLSRLSSAFAAVLFSFSSFQNVWSEFNTVGHTLLWLPLLLTIIVNLVNHNQHPKIYLLWIFALFATLTAGHPQDAIYVLLFTMIFTIWFFLNSHQILTTKLSKLMKLLLVSLLTLGLSSVQLLPTIELFLNSARSAHNAQFIIENLLLQPHQIILFFIQDFFGNPATHSYLLNDTYVIKAVSIGSLGFIFLIIGLFTIRNKPSIFTFFTWTTIITFLLLFRHLLSELFYRFPIPILSTGTPTRIASLFTFSGALLAGYGLDKFSTGKIRLRSLLFIFISLLLFAWIYFSFAVATNRALIFTSIIFTGAIICILFKRRFAFALYGLLLITSLELGYSFLKFNSFVPINYIFPPNPVFNFLKSQPGIDRFWGYGTGRIEANFATQYRLYSPDGTDPLNLNEYNKFLESTSRGDSHIPPGYGPTDLPQNFTRLRLLDLLGVKYILDRFENPKDDTTFPGDRYKKIWESDGWIIYENLLASPRYFLTADIIKTDLSHVKKLIFAPEFKSQTQIIVPADIQLPSDLLPDPNSQINLISYLPSQVTFRTTSLTSQFLYISDVMAPGWNATVDSEPTAIIPTNVVFRSVIVPPGTHTVTFSYFPNSFKYGLTISSISLSLLIIMFALRKPLAHKLSIFLF